LLGISGVFLLIIQGVLAIVFFLLEAEELFLLLSLVEHVISRYINFRKIAYNINRINGYRNISIKVLSTNIIKYSSKVIQTYVWKIPGLRTNILIGLG
jgi:hypothetical protein